MVYRVAMFLVALLATFNMAQAGECTETLTIGTWINPFAGVRSDLTKLEIKEICTAETQPHIQVKAYTSCAPRDCTWGRSIAREIGTTGLEVTFNTFFAIRTITISANGRRMEARILDNYRDPRKADGHRSFVLWRK